MANPVDLLLTQDPARYPDYRLPLWHNPAEDFSPDRGFGSRFRMILIEEGTGVLEVGPWRGPFVAPVIFCLNETERPGLTDRRSVRAQSIYFHPSVVNAAFDFLLIRRPGRALALTEVQDLDSFTPFLRRAPGVFRPVVLGPAAARRISGLMSVVGENLRARNDGGWPCRSRSYFLELLLVVERAYADSVQKDVESMEPPPPAADSVVMFLHANYRERITLADLARRFHTNRTTLARQFHSATGQSVIAYLTRLRMNVAASILRDTELDVGEIMQRVGFRDGTHFGRTFRRYAGCTPSQYRRANCWMLRTGTHAREAPAGDAPPKEFDSPGVQVSK